MSKNMVTRTFITTTATAMLVGVETGEVQNAEITVSGDFTENVKALTRKVAKQVEESGDYKLVKISKAVKNEQLYGMPEDKFLKEAEKLPPRGTKVENKQ